MTGAEFCLAGIQHRTGIPVICGKLDLHHCVDHHTPCNRTLREQDNVHTAWPSTQPPSGGVPPNNGFTLSYWW